MTEPSRKDKYAMDSTLNSHWQQAIEKSFKAVLAEHVQIVPRVHDLNTLRNRVEKYIKLEIVSDLLNQLNELYIDARYPADFGLLPSGKPPKELSQKMYHFAREIYETIEQNLPRVAPYI